MEQFNSDRYKKRSLLQEFFNSCLGRITIFLVILLVAYIFALITVPSKEMMLAETLDNIHECLQENDSIKSDEIDETINNISRTFSVADTTYTNPELYRAFKKHNRLQVFTHPGFQPVLVFNGMYPQGRRISIGIFQHVISTVCYDDLVVSTEAIRGEYNKRLNAPEETPAEEERDLEGELNVEPYHFEGNSNY